jgi:hypothetical protein
MNKAVDNSFMSEILFMSLDFTRALDKEVIAKVAMMPIITTTTNNSIKVKPWLFLLKLIIINNKYAYIIA